jgi:hypothetical protein
MTEDHEMVVTQIMDDGDLMLTFKGRSYFMRKAGPGNTLPIGHVFAVGNSGRRRQPVLMVTMPIGNAIHDIAEGKVSKAYHTFFLRPEDFQALKDIGYRSARKKFQVIVGSKP